MTKEKMFSNPNNENIEREGFLVNDNSCQKVKRYIFQVFIICTLLISLMSECWVNLMLLMKYHLLKTIYFLFLWRKERDPEFPSQSQQMSSLLEAGKGNLVWTRLLLWASSWIGQAMHHCGQWDHLLEVKTVEQVRLESAASFFLFSSSSCWMHLAGQGLESAKTSQEKGLWSPGSR